MKKVEIWCWASNNGEYLYEGDCFEEQLLKEFRKYEKFCANDDWYILLQERIKAKKDEMHEQEILDILFREKISLDFEFAIKLNLFDVIGSKCFTAFDGIGSAIIQLCLIADLNFIVSRKLYHTKESVEISFEVCGSDYICECHKALITQNI